MDWLNQTTEYSKIDVEEFKFHPGEKFQIRALILTVEDGRVVIHKPKESNKPSVLSSEAEYTEWLERCDSFAKDQPAFFLVMHERHGDHANSLPYSKETFEAAAEELYQHRSLAWNMQRTSTVIFNSKRADWTVNGAEEQSIVLLKLSTLRECSADDLKVYNCKSDTQTLEPEDDVLVSTTYFTSRPWTFSVMYGCDSSMNRLVTRLEKFNEHAFHPLVVPMMFVEHERGRLMNAMELKSTELEQRILGLENKLREDEHRKTRTREEVKRDNQEMTKKDCESTKVWDDVSNLKNGMASFRKVLVALEQQLESKAFEELELRTHVRGTGEMIAKSKSSEYIRCRIKELDAEADSNIRKCESLLAGMALAIQVEWNYHTRRDARANIFIARASRQDSNQMKLISWVGMAFLPGTFLATFFSMSFFQWIPDDSPQVISPWVGVYLGLTALITGGIVLLWWQRTKDDPNLDSELAELWDYAGIDRMERGQPDETSRKDSQDSSISRFLGEKLRFRTGN